MAGDLRVTVQGNQAPPALIHLALVPASQDDWQPLLRSVSSEQNTLLIRDLPPGRYAIAIYQDSNGNGQLDQTPRGLPLEPVGFSGRPSLLHGKPSPQASAFDHGEADSDVQVRLRQPRGQRAAQDATRANSH